ncbi:MAG: hypothetical protein ACOYJF_05125 [Prevotella sp.]|jgi:hypothetical protein
MNTELYKIRSVKACIADAYQLFEENFKTILRRTWLPSLILSLVVGVYLCFNTVYSAMPSAGLSVTDSIKLLAGTVVFILAFYGVLFFLSGRFFSMLNGQPVRFNYFRSLKLTLLGILIGVAIVLITMAVAIPLTKNSSPYLFAQVLKVAGLVCLVLLIFAVALIPPMSYSFMKYMMEPQTKLKSVMGSFLRRGYRRYGFLLGLLLLVALIYYVIQLIINIPVGILTFAGSINQFGIDGGDVSGLPSTFGIITFVVTTCITFISNYVGMWFLLNFYYAYGSVEARTSEGGIGNVNFDVEGTNRPELEESDKTPKELPE